MKAPEATIARDLGYVKEFAIEASALRLPVGEWPATIQVQGSSEPLLRGAAKRDAEGDIQSVMYTSRDGKTRLTVFND